MSDTSAQPAKKMVSRFVSNQNSAIGSLLRRSVSNKSQTSISATQDQADSVTPVTSTTPVLPVTDPVQNINDQTTPMAQAVPPVSEPAPDLALLEEAITEAENKTTQVDESPVTEPIVDPVAQNATDVVADDQISTDQPGVIPQIIPQVLTTATDTLNPQHPVKTAGGKEAGGPVSLDQVAIDVARGAQQVEVEPSPEIPPEVESYLQKVEDHANTAPKEIVIADGSNTQPNNHNYPSQPVVVLPITPEIEKQGANKSTRFSVRWLVEWSRKIMKMFSGKVIYRLPEEVKQ